LNRVKNKILNHLSHELKTPLAVIDASLKVMERRLGDEGIVSDRLPFDRIRRNLARLKTIEKQCSHIVEDQEEPERKVISAFLDRLGDLIEIEQDDEPQLRTALDALRRSIEAHFPRKAEQSEGISVEAAFDQEEFRIRQMLQDRELNLDFVKPDPAILRLQPHIMRSTLRGLVRNAIENTPDKGRIVVTGKNLPSGYRITVTDCGVGIPESEQPNIFEGFYPVQETDMYSSGRRYEFNAGGTGTDLLKIRIFSERFGFKIGFTSTRCPCIPTARDRCPGDITKCSCCETIEDCYGKGGTEFVLDFPSDMVEAVAQDPEKASPA
jgi:signal transduction histidine kinase